MRRTDAGRVCNNRRCVQLSCRSKELIEAGELNLSCERDDHSVPVGRGCCLPLLNVTRLRLLGVLSFRRWSTSVLAIVVLASLPALWTRASVRLPRGVGVAGCTVVAGTVIALSSGTAVLTGWRTSGDVSRRDAEDDDWRHARALIVISPKFCARGTPRFLASLAGAGADATASDELNRTHALWIAGAALRASEAAVDGIDDGRRASMGTSSSGTKVTSVSSELDRDGDSEEADVQETRNSRYGDAERRRRAAAQAAHTALASHFHLLALVAHGATHWPAVCILHDMSHLLHSVLATNLRNMALVRSRALY